MALKNKRITQDDDLESVLREPGWIPAAPERLAEIHAAAKRSLKLRRGGARAGAGRKPLPEKKRRVQISASVAPETARRLRARAKKAGVSLGASLDRLLAASASA